MKLVRTHSFKLLPEETELLRRICLSRGCSLSDGIRMGLLFLAVHHGYDAEVLQALEEVANVVLHANGPATRSR